MRYILSVAVAGFLLAASAPAASAATAVSLDKFPAKMGASVMFDIKNGVGYMMYEGEPTYVSFPIGSGQPRMVNYLGMRYFAATPIRTWVVRSITIQSDRKNFGKDGLFLRLDGSRYGIHTIRDQSFLTWSPEERKISYGCPLVSDEILERLYEIYKLNSEYLHVTTTWGPDEVIDALVYREQVQEQRLTAQYSGEKE